ncbi:putative glycolipid-binding domain-containing protein [Longispora sp. K20-0274]|uniref:putative glycolipid-binding domain-containing protein n=1 Tax=Longispora sp. K20-0274 TaxID=3088255 RepID=UPI00399B358D
MTVYPSSRAWQRVDPPGTELALFREHAGLTAEGSSVVGGARPYTLRYSLVTDDLWRTQRFDVEVAGAGWRRTARLEHAAGRWRVATGEEGQLDGSVPGIDDADRLEDAVDVDLGFSALTNTLPIRRLDLLSAPVGTVHKLTMVFVRVPTLEVYPHEQTYTVVGPGRIGYWSLGYTAELAIDDHGYVTHYPGLASVV